MRAWRAQGVVRAVSYQVADHVRGGRLRLVLEAYEPTRRPVHLVYDKQNRLPAQAARLC